MNDTMLFPNARRLQQQRFDSPRLEIIGIFGSGKSTLAEQLSVLLTSECLLEKHESNPYWGKKETLETFGYFGYELFFLIHHASLIQTVSNLNDCSKIQICDWSFVTDVIWARERLSLDEFDDYMKIATKFSGQLGAPKAYLYLDERPSVILERINSRGRTQEAGVTVDMLEHAQGLIEAAVSKIENQKLIRINSDTCTASLITAIRNVPSN